MHDAERCPRHTEIKYRNLSIAPSEGYSPSRAPSSLLCIYFSSPVFFDLVTSFPHLQYQPQMHGALGGILTNINKKHNFLKGLQTQRWENLVTFMIKTH